MTAKKRFGDCSTMRVSVGTQESPLLAVREMVGRSRSAGSLRTSLLKRTHRMLPFILAVAS